jgi:cytochrome b561
MNILNKRGVLKFLHWITAALILYFFLVEPDLPNSGTNAMMTAELSTHAGMGFLLSIIVVVWTLVFVRGGLVGKPGPKLPDWAKKIHPIMHKGLHLSLPIMLITGLAVGLTAPFQVLGFGVIPLNVPFIGGTALNDLANEIHEFSFDVLMLLIVGHSVFHLWRHFLLKDNALRLILPKPLHKLL